MAARDTSDGGTGYERWRHGIRAMAARDTSDGGHKKKQCNILILNIFYVFILILKSLLNPY
jgi:hypothetical protein